MSDIKLGNNNVTFKLGSTDVNAIYLGDTLIYSGSTPPTPHDYSQDYLTFRALEDGTFSFSTSGMSYSVDNGSTWTELAASANTPTVASGSTILWKSTKTAVTNNGIGTFGSSGNFEVEGNIMSLEYGDNFSGQTSLTATYAFFKLFNALANLKNAENLVLPATTLTNYCYQYMFQGCRNLTTAPSILPATTLSTGCYWYMFNSCTSLTESPVLPAATLTQYCYRYMFQNCYALSAVTCLATDISANNCTQYWITSVPASGTFYKASTMDDWTTGDNGIPSNWTVQNYSS